MREILHPQGHRWEKTVLVDAEAIDQERVIGEITVVGDVVRVRVARRIEFDLLTDPITCRVHPPRITLGDTFELTAQHDRELAGMLARAADLVDEIEAENP